MGCLVVSVGVCWCLLVCCVPWRCHGVVWGVSEGYLSGIHRNWRRSDVFGGYVGSQSLQYGAKTLFRHSPERHNFCRLTILRHSNIKMVAYKLSKNGWVMPFFVIFRLAREKLLVTVALDHPVVEIIYQVCINTSTQHRLIAPNNAVTKQFGVPGLKVLLICIFLNRFLHILIAISRRQWNGLVFMEDLVGGLTQSPNLKI